MARKTLYGLEELILHYKPENLSMEGGTIESAVFQKPSLLKYRFTFPKGFKFPPEFYKLKGFDRTKELSFEISMKHSEKTDIVLSGLSSDLYARILQEFKKGNKYTDTDNFRFILCMEHQSLISLVSVFENFLKNVQRDNDQNEWVFNRFKSINGALYNCDIECKNLEGLRDEKIFNRMKEIIDYLFDLRNLIVHNGGVVNPSFYRKYRKKVSKKEIGKIIRVKYEDYEIIRQWLSYFIQEVCRVNKGYNAVWTDYLLSTGIILPNTSLRLKTSNGKEITIPLQDGVEIIGKYKSENYNEDRVEHRPKTDRTFSFELDMGKLIVMKRSKKKNK